jgi:hypothetical protein
MTQTLSDRLYEISLLMANTLLQRKPASRPDFQREKLKHTALNGGRQPLPCPPRLFRRLSSHIRFRSSIPF